MRDSLIKSGLWVVKIGSALLTDSGKSLQLDKIQQWVGQIATLQQLGYQVVLVSSGAIAAGMARLGWSKKPHEIYKQQAAAAVGQSELIKAYENCFDDFGLITAQILLTHDDIANRKRYLNAKSAIKTLLDLGIVPIINENDTVSVDEIRFGDNDSLAGLVVNLLDADSLIILTDQLGMFDKNPREFTDATLLSEVNVADKKLDKMASNKGGDFGKGGMMSKLSAARIAARSGADTVIAGGLIESVLLKLQKGEPIGTLLKSGKQSLDAKTRWLAGQMKTLGKLTLNTNAVSTFLSDKSLTMSGILSVVGEFHRGDLISCLDETGLEIGRGLVNYNHIDVNKIIGLSADKIEQQLGFIDEAELISRDNLVIL